MEAADSDFRLGMLYLKSAVGHRLEAVKAETTAKDALRMRRFAIVQSERAATLMTLGNGGGRALHERTLPAHTGHAAKSEGDTRPKFG